MPTKRKIPKVKSRAKRGNKSAPKPSTATMLFHGFGAVSEEEYDILKVEPTGVIVLDTDEEKTKCFRFDSESGACLNDLTDFGCYRTLKLNSNLTQ